MAQQTVNLGAAPDDGTGDTLRVGGDKINDNFTELYTFDLGLGTGSSPQFAGINLGHASDTTITRVSAGVAAIEGVNIVTTAGGVTFAADIVVPDEAYDATAWNASLEVPTKNAIRDKIESLAGGVTTLDGLTDVNAPTPSNNDVLTWDSTPGEWVAAAGGGGGYTPGGTDVALADGGTGASLADPNADRILFWDDSAGAMTWLTPGTGLTITTTTINAAAGAMTLLETLSPSAAATVESTAFAGLGYREVLFIYEITVSNDDASIVVRWRVGGSIISAGSYFRAGAGRTSSATTAANDATTGTGLLLNLSGANFGVGNAATEGADGRLYVYNPDNATRYKNAKVSGSYTNPNGSLVNIDGSGSYHGGTGAIEGVEFSATAGTITGTIKVYGIN